MNKNPKEALGFHDGYVTIFKGDTYLNKEWLKENGAIYRRLFGWIMPSNLAIPAEMPYGIEPVRLEWAKISDDGVSLNSDERITEIINSLVYESSPSNFQGVVGEYFYSNLLVVKNMKVDSKYGTSTLHEFKDENGNVFTWFTSSKDWEVGSWHKIKGKVKAHKVYRNVKQTVLYYVREEK